MDALKTDELRARFANEYLENIIWGALDPIVTMAQSDDVSRVINKIKKFVKSCF